MTEFLVSDENIIGRVAQFFTFEIQRKSIADKARSLVGDAHTMMMERGLGNLSRNEVHKYFRLHILPPAFERVRAQNPSVTEASLWNFWRNFRECYDHFNTRPVMLSLASEVPATEDALVTITFNEGNNSQYVKHYIIQHISVRRRSERIKPTDMSAAACNAPTESKRKQANTPLYV
jgi:hypothetical protein